MLLDPKIPTKIVHLEKTYDLLRFAPVAAVEMEIAETREHFRSVPQLDYRPVSVGTAWGENWGNAWFRGRVSVPAELDGESLFVRADTGAPESLFLVDGVHRGVFDPFHPVRLLDLRAQGGKSYEIALEAYAGHSFPGTQPYEYVRPTENAVEVTPGCRIYKGVELVRERADVSAFVNELRALRQVAAALDPNSLRRARIQTMFGEVFQLVYAKPEETDEATWREAIAEACKVMRPLLEAKNGSSIPQMGIVGHSHIDTAWLWPIRETWRKLARTYSSVLSLMDQYPEFRFTQSAAYHYDVVRQLYPEIFERVRQRVREGRWEVNGAMWIEPDCNLPSGESFVRQLLVGQRATREMFGVTSDCFWQPDVFGYSASLPQILQSADVRFFLTTKLSWNDTNRFPYDTFVWQGIDGSTVISHFNEMQGWPDPESLTRLWGQVQHKDVQDRRLVGFGHGDGGGGPMAEMIEIARLTEDLEGCPKTAYTSMSEFMNGVQDELPDLPRWVGELYLELHRGTLTSIAAIKRFNRKCEFALRDAELAATLAALNGTPYPREPMLDTWKRLLLNQFHDILPGSSIAEVNDEALDTFDLCLSEANSLRDQALAAIAGKGDHAVLFNSMSWVRGGEIVLKGLPEGLSPAGSVAQPIVDVAGERSLAVSGVEIPALGFTGLPLVAAEECGASAFGLDDLEVRTPFAHVRFDESGRIISFFDLAARRELVSLGGTFNNLLMGEDVPAAWDNWDIDRDQRHKLKSAGRLIKKEVVADGPLQLRIRFEYELGRESRLVQDVVFHSTTPRVDFDTWVDWHERYQFLKVGFALDVLAETARHEIQFGHVVRNAHDNTSQDRAQFDVCTHKWSDISETGYGVAFINDCKYACTIKEGEYRLSLIKSGRRPDPRGDEGEHRFAYAMLPHAGGFSVESVIRPAYEFNVDVTAALGGGSDSFSLVQIDAPNVIVEAVKWAEDEDAVILRIYEASKTGTHAKLRFGFATTSVEETNLLEERPTPVRLENGEAKLYFRPFEIQTLRCRR
ncbi:alpha-mannosidase [Fimbriimonas ginsengisoli]|uniref:Alpha-mannosidase n=1 Tax=Fimbriimonas ginsengisoli Gsoil 348 TaxID=661478 RepID=A0A068NQJ0_FIMGI|nr:glycoside hydrolase family 38 C-terminal domain-containing protein [Fimbriimonas ginsengisoli]AIE85691.1 Alpha-mannosidase [Fimbriimonas ginsengisoli Gsoil 348]